MSWNSLSNPSPATSPSATPKAKGNRANIVIWSLIILGIIAGIAAFVMMRSRPNPPAKPTTSTLKPTTPPPTNKVAKVAPSPKPTKVEPPVTNANVRMENGIEVLKSSVTTNSSGYALERLWLANGKTKLKVHPPKPIFENASDSLIATLLSVKPGQSSPPLPDISSIDDDFAKSLLSPIRIKDDDSENVKELKAQVIEARAYLAEEVKKGGTVREALRKYQADLEQFSDSHAMAAQQIKEIRETDGDEAAEEFRQRINESFRARGIPELSGKKDAKPRSNPQP